MTLSRARCSSRDRRLEDTIAGDCRVWSRPQRNDNRGRLRHPVDLGVVVSVNERRVLRLFARLPVAFVVLASRAEIHDGFNTERVGADTYAVDPAPLRTPAEGNRDGQEHDHDGDRRHGRFG